MAQSWSSNGRSNLFFWILNQYDQGCSMPNFTILGVSHSPLFLKWPNVALLLLKHSPHLVLQLGSSWIIINVPREATCQISQHRVFPMVPFSKKWPKYGPFVAKTWSSHGPSNCFFLNHNQCAQGCSMPNFTNLGVSHCPLFLEMAKIWPFYGQNMVLTWSVKLVLPESSSLCLGIFHAKFHMPGCIL